VRPLHVTLAILLLGCTLEPNADTPLTPHALYEQWWGEMERCSGRRGQFHDIAWYLLDSETKAGYYLDRKIWIHPDWTESRNAVAHEELHALGVKGHDGWEWRACLS
jgi:hypothetical protein